MILTLSELKDKEVINLCDGKRLGLVCDAEFDSSSGAICSLLLPGKLCIPGIRKGGAIKIPWGCIDRIGKDLILVRLDLPKKQ
jgi:YlmC/YmxH family sporulation protein